MYYVLHEYIGIKENSEKYMGQDEVYDPFVQ
jgi:hypothetical protein